MDNKFLQHKILKSENGFTLIDVAVALLVIGILAAPLVQQYRIWLLTSKQQLTAGRAQNARDAIEQYYFVNNRYPCPADPRLGPSDADFGMELRDFGGTGQCDTSATALGPFTVTSALDADGVGGNDPVYMGMLPFKSLSLSPHEALDSWNNKLTYAVSGLLTNEATFAGIFGGITIREDFVMRHPTVLDATADPAADNVCTDTSLLVPGAVPPAQVYGPVNNVHYVIFSHGKNGNGAYYNANNAAPARACDMAAADAENCNNITNNEATFLYDTCQSSSASDANNYDDIFVANNITLSSAPFANWNPAVDQQNAGAPTGFYGINNALPEAELDVIGNVRASLDPLDSQELGRLYSHQYCDGNGGNCMKPEAIAGEEPDMRCGFSGTAMRGVAHNQVRCNIVVQTLSSATCPGAPGPQQYVTGFSASGQPCCNNVCP